MSEIEKQIGFNIRQLREKKGFSQEQLAAAADLHRTHIGRIERGEKTPTVKTLHKIAQGLGVDLKDLFS